MPHFVIMGAGRVGVMLARTLEASGHTVAVIDQDIRAFQPLRKNFGGKLVTGVGFDKETLERAGIGGAAGRSHTRGEGGSRPDRHREGEGRWLKNVSRWLLFS